MKTGAMKSNKVKTESDWDQDINKIIMEIHQNFPELVKYITEIPLKVSVMDSNEINSKNLQEYYNSLVELVNDYSKTHSGTNAINTLPIDLNYPPSEDIYNQGKKVMNLNPEDLSENKAPNEEKGSWNEKNFEDDRSGGDLDVPGSELDDQQENSGSEDEENNYYSLGGDNHNDLDEDKG